MMADLVDAVTRSRMMSGIRAKNTQPELVVRRLLHACGFRFRLHRKDLPGNPDIVLPRYRAVILIQGCFWHRHEDCRYATTPKTRPEFWGPKFSSNIQRDTRNEAKLRQAGWRIGRIWECAIRRDPEAVAAHLAVGLPSKSPSLDVGAKDGISVVNVVEYGEIIET